MSALSPFLRHATDGIHFWCRGCNRAHGFVLKGDGPKWNWNDSVEKLTFTPLLIRSGHYITGNEDRCWCAYNAEHPDTPTDFTRSICHSFVTDGMIQFLSDCTHALGGKIVPLPEWPSAE